MSFTLRQVQPLLTKPELELFEASRAGAITSLAPRQLNARLTRARTLRDKYRDNYRRQTVATRTGPATKRTLQGAENVRTATKAEIMADLVTRFEAQLAKAEAQAAKSAARKTPRTHNAPGAPTTRTNPKAAQRSRRSSGAAEPGVGADLPMRGAAGTKKRQVARSKRVAADVGHAVVSARGAQSLRAGAAAGKKAAATRTAAKKAPAKKAPATKSAAKKSAAKKTTAKTAITGAKQPAAKLVKQVRSAVEKKQAAAPVQGQPRARRAIRAKVGGSATANAHGAVPTNMPAKAQRLNPLKAQPINKTIHASARARQQVATAKRDAR